jgi:hypothetical protein
MAHLSNEEEVTTIKVEEEREQEQSQQIKKQQYATKITEGKPDLTLLSYEWLSLLAEVRAFGAKKYGRDNWKQGMKASESLAAAMRHIMRYKSGELVDPESGKSHLGHAGLNLEHVVWTEKYYPELLDLDQAKKQDAEGKMASIPAVISSSSSTSSVNIVDHMRDGAEIKPWISYVLYDKDTGDTIEPHQAIVRMSRDFQILKEQLLMMNDIVQGLNEQVASLNLEVKRLKGWDVKAI